MDEMTIRRDNIDNLEMIVNEAQQGASFVILDDDGKPQAALIGYDEYVELVNGIS